MMRRLLQGIGAILLIAALAFAYVWSTRSALPYNSEGRYLDASQGVVLHEQSVIVFGAAACVCCTCAVIAWLVSRKL